VQMWVIYPPNFDPKKKWPLLQVLHGGPHSAVKDEFRLGWNFHLFASRGTVVAAVNFHGSTGWGQAFADSITGQLGTKEFEDVEKATDYLIATGYIDPPALGRCGLQLRRLPGGMDERPHGQVQGIRVPGCLGVRLGLKHDVDR